MKVTNQSGLDAALNNPRVSKIEIDSPRGVWLSIRDNKGKSVEAWGNSSVEARENSSVEAWENSSVVARENSSVEAWGNSSVVARENSSVVARENSSVEARENSSVEAWGNSSVEAWGNSSVEARENSSVEAWGNSSVEAWGASSTHTYGPPVKAGPKCAVFVHSARAVVEGGVVIDVIDSDKEPADWAEWHGAAIEGDRAIVYKAVNDRFTTDRGFDYTPGVTVTAPDWRDDADCGHGLHFGPTPRHARDYFWGATRFVKVSIPLDAARPIPGGVAKIKARECLVLGEVDINGKAVSA